MPIGRVTKYWQLLQASWEIYKHGGLFSLARRLAVRFLVSIDRLDWLSQSRRSYRHWLANHLPSREELNAQKIASERLAKRPIVSLLLDAQGGSQQLLATIASIKNQTYPYWELVLYNLDTVSPLPLFQNNEQVVFQAGNLNDALSQSSGDFFLRLSAGDRLAPSLLFEVVQLINQQEQTAIVYFNESVIDSVGQHQRPFVKPATFDPYYLLSCNYLAHSIFRKNQVLEAGGFGGSTGKTAELEMILKLIETEPRVEHLARFLFFVTEQNTEKPTPKKAKILEGFFQDQGLRQPKVELNNSNHYHFSWDFNPPKISIIIPNRDLPEVLRLCVETILSISTYPDYEIIIVDNESSEPKLLNYYSSLIVRYPKKVKLLFYPERFNYSRANNLGAAQATGNLLLFLNNDTQPIHPDWLEEMAMWFENDKIGMVGSKLLYRNNKIQHLGVTIGLGGLAGHLFSGIRNGSRSIFTSTYAYREVISVTGACSMVRREAFDEIGGYDEKYQLVYSDVQIGIDLREVGWKVLLTPFSRLYHFEGRTRKRQAPSSDFSRAYARFKPFLVSGDPYFSPTLSLVSPKPILRPPQEMTTTDRVAHRITEEVVDRGA